MQHQQSSGSLLSGSPPQSGRASPPTVSPGTYALQHQQPQQQQPQQQQQQQLQQQQLQQLYQLQQEPLELQIDYWPIIKPGIEKEKNQNKAIDQGKNSIKSTFRSLQVIQSNWAFRNFML